MVKNTEVSLFKSALKLDKLVYIAKERRWTAKIITEHVDKIHDVSSVRLAYNTKGFDDDLKRLEDEIEHAKKNPDLFNGSVKSLQKELKDLQDDRDAEIKAFGEIKFTTVVDSFTQKNDGKTAMTIRLDSEQIAEIEEKVGRKQDWFSSIEFYI